MRRNIRWGIDLYWWRHRRDGITRSAAAITPAAIFFPFQNRQIFLKAGVGLAQFTASTEEEELRAVPLAGMVGAGYEIPLSQKYSLIPYVSYVSGGGGTMRLNGERVTSDAGMSLRQYGLAFLWR
jgi:hypothetical protein